MVVGSQRCPEIFRHRMVPNLVMFRIYGENPCSPWTYNSWALHQPGTLPPHHLDTGEEGPSVSWLDGYAASKNKQEPTLDYWALVLLIHRYTQGECNPLKVE